jgi:hypothetical protein
MYICCPAVSGPHMEKDRFSVAPSSIICSKAMRSQHQSQHRIFH